MKIRILAGLLAVLLTLALAACATPVPTTAPTAAPPPGNTEAPNNNGGGDDPGGGGDPGDDYTGGLPDGVVTNEPITLTAYQWALDNQSTDFQNLWFYQQLEEETGVSIDFNVIKEDDWNTQINLMFISGDYPDLIIRPNDGFNIEEYGVTQGIVIPLDGYIQANMPNYAPRLDMNRAGEIMRASDGKMYYIGYMSAQGVVNNAHWFINHEWLAAVGKSVPTTIDELTDVLLAFRDEKPGTGTNIYPMSGGGNIYHQTNGIYTYFSMFGVPLQYFVYAAIQDDGTVVFPGFMDGFREACEWLAMCYAEDLLDKESLTQGDGGMNAKVNADEVGFQTYLRLFNTAWDAAVLDNWTPIIPPAGSQGVTVPRDYSTDLPAYGAVLTTANQYVPQTLRWLDAQFETERMLAATNGPGQGGPIDPCIELGADGVWKVLYVPEDNGLYNYVPVTQGQFFAPGDYIFDIFEMPPHRIERYQNSQSYEAAGVVEKNSYLTLTRLVRPTPDEATRQERLYEDIHKFMQEEIAAFITGGVTDASWDSFVEKARNVGVDEYVATYQKLYDEFLAGQS
ncbi:MAG: extracellular solute-binding protein [Oscillospiraceae bacterium]|nr:extracellular solute-binding protein [Oscillospiraceae bacterium]